MGCFTAESTLAHEYFDFDKVMRTKSNEDSNTIDENEIAFKMRMDERVIPVGPRTDNSHVTITIESEVYYTGNQHPTRRRLQTGEQLQRQRSSKSMMHRVYYKGTEIESCDMDEDLDEVEIDVVFDYDTSRSKAPEDVNEANNWSMNLKMKLESHLDVKNAISVTKVEKCVDKDCTMYLSTKPRRMEFEGEKVYASLVVKCTKDSKAGKIANTLQTELKRFAFEAEVVHMTSPDCSTKSTGLHNSKLASTAFAASGLIAFLAAFLAAL